jgi:hypothetical protein
MRVSPKDVRRTSRCLPEIRFADQDLTSYGGLVVLDVLLKDMDVHSRFDRAVRHVKTAGAYAASRIVLLLVVHLFLGNRRLRDIDLYKNDALVQRVLELKRIPDTATVSRRLTEFDDQSDLGLRQVLRDIVAERAIAASPRRLTLDIDGSVISTNARGIEGTAIGYNPKKKGARSYYPLFGSIAQTGQVFDLLHRAGNCHDSVGALAFILDSAKHLGTAGFRGVLEVRMDGAHYSDATCAALDGAAIEFSVSVPFERIPRLKAMIEERVLWHRIDDDWSYFELAWRPSGASKRSYRTIVYRRRVLVPRQGPIQLDLFVPIERNFEFKVVMTNKQIAPGKLLSFHNGRGSQEATFAEAKSGLALGYLPSRRQIGNQIYMLCNLIALALGRELQMRSAAPRSLVKTPTPACLWALERISTLRRNVIQRAAQLTRPQGRLVLTFAHCPALQARIHSLFHGAAAAA